MPEYFPAVLFASAGALCIAIAIAEWNVRRRLAISLVALGGCSIVCLAANHAWDRYSIRVDLLLTIPAVSFGALVAGTLATMRPPATARVLGAMLALGGAVSFAWFSYAMHGSYVQGVRITALFDEGNRLYWAETVLFYDNFEKQSRPLMPLHSPSCPTLSLHSR